MKTNVLIAAAMLLAMATAAADAQVLTPESSPATAIAVQALPEGFVPAPTGKGWRDGYMWRETDQAGRKIVRCLSGGKKASLYAAPTGLHQSCNGSERNFSGWTELNTNRIIKDRDGNRWTVYIMDNKERWTDAFGNVTTCSYTAETKSCKFPDPATIKVTAPAPETDA